MINKSKRAFPIGISDDGKIPPHDIEAEEAVIGSLLIDSDAFYEIKPIIGADNFFISQCRWIYEACIEIMNRNEAIDQITVAHELANKGKLEEIGGTSYLSQLIAQCPTSLNILHYANIVRRCSLQRKAIHFGYTTTAKSYEIDDSKELISSIGKDFLDLQNTIGLPSLISPEQMARFGVDRYTMLREGKGIAVKTGFRTLDYELGGIFPGEYWLLGARPGVGKTSLLISMGENIAMQGNVLWCSLEMPWESILDRRIATLVEKHPREIRGGMYNEDTFGNIINKLAQISETSMYFYGIGDTEMGITTDAIYAVARYMQLSYGLKAIIIDYLGLFEDNYGKSNYDRMTYISRRIKNITRNLNVPIICACQLSRALEQHVDKKPQLSDLRESGHLEEDADGVWFLYRDDYYDPEVETKGDAELIIAKQRQGDANKSIDLKWDNRKRCYIDANSYNEVPEQFR